MAGSPVNVRISRENYQRLQTLCAQTRMPKGRIVDDALSLFFTPPEERSDRILLRRMDRIDEAISQTNGNIAFNGDMIAEFVWRWLAAHLGDPASAAPAQERDTRQAFVAFTECVLERGQES